MVVGTVTKNILCTLKIEHYASRNTLGYSILKMNIQICKLEPMSNAVRCTTMLCFTHITRVYSSI